jgi:hypothetical protein
MSIAMFNQLIEAVRATASVKPRLTVTFAPRRLHCPPRLSQNAYLSYSSCSSVNPQYCRFELTIYQNILLLLGINLHFTSLLIFG